MRPKYVRIADRSLPHRPKSQTGKAIDYTLGLWDKLSLYTEHAQMEFENNLVENAIRPSAIGKKNWLFFGSAEAGRTSAIHYILSKPAVNWKSIPTNSCAISCPASRTKPAALPSASRLIAKINSGEISNAYAVFGTKVIV